MSRPTERDDAADADDAAGAGDAATPDDLVDADDATTPDDPPAAEWTDIGVRVGVDTLIAAAPADGDIATGLEIDGAHLHDRREILAEATQALQAANFDTTRGETELFVAMYHQIRPQVYSAAARTIQHAQRFDAPRLVLANRYLRPGSLWPRRSESDLAAWLPAALRQAVAEKARKADVPVMRVDPGSTSRQCHDCGVWGAIHDDGVLVCRNDDCPVNRVRRSLSSAVSLARQVRR